MPQKFITLEGIDGCGKSTQTRLVVRALRAAGMDVLQLREPGGTEISEKIRALLLDPANEAMGTTCELLLYEAARAQLVDEVITPALEAGKVVVCDRFYDSTTAYQAYAGGIELSAVETANALAVGSCKPDATLVFDVDVEQAAARTAKRAADRMEAKGLAFQQRVREGFRSIAAADPVRVQVIDAGGDVPHVFACVVEQLRAAGLMIPEEALATALAEELGR